jgi:hypothetical protein
MDNQEHGILMNEIRYAQRITQRTARFYRHLSTLFTFTAIIGGSGLATSIAGTFPHWIVLAGGVLLACTGAASLAIRPIEKAIINEQDYKKYAALETVAVSMPVNDLRMALAKARETDVAEIELLRDVAYNDVVIETGRPDLQSALTIPQKLIAALA